MGCCICNKSGVHHNFLSSFFNNFICKSGIKLLITLVCLIIQTTFTGGGTGAVDDPG